MHTRTNTQKCTVLNQTLWLYRKLPIFSFFLFNLFYIFFYPVFPPFSTVLNYLLLLLFERKNLNKNLNYHQLNRMKFVRGWCGFPYFILYLFDSFSFSQFSCLCLCLWLLLRIKLFVTRGHRNSGKIQATLCEILFMSTVQNKLNDLLGLLTPLNTYYFTFHSFCLCLPTNTFGHYARFNLIKWDCGLYDDDTHA